MVEWTYLALEMGYFALGTLSMIKTLKDWKENKNRVLIAISIYMVAVLLRSIIDLAVFLGDFNVDVIVFGYVTFGQILGNILFVIQLEFMFFLKKLTKFYSLPPIIAFYIVYGRTLVDSILPFVIYAMIVSYSSAYILIRDGKRRQNGLAIGMGLFFLLWGIGQTLGPNTPIIFISFRLVAMLALFLGTRGFYEKYVFPDQKKEEKIMNTWITKLVVKE